MSTRTDQQKRIVELAAEEFGKGKGIDNSTTGALLLYIQELETENSQLVRDLRLAQREADIFSGDLANKRTWEL